MALQLEHVAEHELVVLMPNSLATGDPGDPISAPVQEIIYAFAHMGYGVVDFGEADDVNITLWFSQCGRPIANRMARRFIKSGGDV